MLNTASIDIGATLTPSGGTATTLKTKKMISARNMHILYLDDNSALNDQTTVECSQKEPRVNSGAPNGYTQARNILLVKDPFLLDNGETTINSIRVEQSCDAELTAAEKLELRVKAALMLIDSDLQEFWDEQSLA